MKYYYDVLVNLNEELYDFYEWSKNDILIHIKSIPIIRVDSSTIKQIIHNKIKITNDLFLKIKNQVITSDEKIENAILFTDMYTSLVVEFDSLGREIGISRLSLQDDLNVLEIVFSLELENIILKNLRKRPKNGLRQDQAVKRLLKIEYDTLYKNKDYSKLSYLYFEKFHQDAKDFEKCYQELINDLNVITKSHYDLCYLIKFTYQTT